MKKNKFLKINIILILTFLINVFISTSQSTPDTLELEINRPYKYYKVTEIDSSFIGKEVFIDFKNNPSDTIVYNIKDFDFEINMFSTKDEFDTGLGDGNAFYLFLENWIFDTKTGYLKDYYLNSKNIIHTNPNANCFITKIKISKLPILNKTEYFEFIFDYYIIFDDKNNKITYRLEKFPQTYGIDWIKGFVIFDKEK